jgi:hypothetical protein
VSGPLTDRHLSWLRTFRGYTEDEAELAAMAADEIERLRVALRLVEFGSCDGCGRGGFCHWCSQQDEFDFQPDHLPACPVAAALA